MMGFGFFGIGMLLMLAFWILIIGGAVWLVMTLARGSQGQATARGAMTVSAPNATALELLKTRYAKGEISKEQFDVMKRSLEA